MQDSKLDLISALKFEKRLKTSVAVYLSIILLTIIGVLVKIDMASELQQALIVILGLITIATIDAFRKALDNTRSSLVDQFSQIIVQDGGLYVGGDYMESRTVNQGIERRQTLAEAADEIQQLLMQLEKSQPAATEAEKVAYVNDETPIDLKSRLVNALKAGGESAVVETTLDNSPYVNVVKAILKGWISSRDLSSTDNDT
ncbi:hypothetical protein [Microcoleus vaginatus]|uniref:hypothetical protein n=1 Tax=Microcoleus vaginatus TaxID=119532 RepID=UPI001F61A611